MFSSQEKKLLTDTSCLIFLLMPFFFLTTFCFVYHFIVNILTLLFCFHITPVKILLSPRDCFQGFLEYFPGKIEPIHFIKLCCL